MAVDDLLPFIRTMMTPADGATSGTGFQPVGEQPGDTATPPADGRTSARAEDRDPAPEAVTAPCSPRSRGGSSTWSNVGLEYLALDRGSDTLSGGELQRARLAAQLGSGLVGTCYILDEPTAGLHPRDTGRLIASLRRLQEMGNSVVVVEHDESLIRAADWVVNLGPGAGPDGGTIVAAATPDRLPAVAGSITGRYLGRAPPPSRRGTPAAGWRGVRAGSRSAAPPSTTSSTSTPGSPWRP